MSKSVDEILHSLIAEIEHCGEASQWIIDEAKSALATLIKAEMPERKRCADEPFSSYHEGLYTQYQLDREAVDRVMGIASKPAPLEYPNYGAPNISTGEVTNKPQGGEVGE